MRTAGILVALAGVAATAGGTYGVVQLAGRERARPARCGAELIPLPTRCCAPGQTTVQGRCAGEPASCPRAFHLSEQRSGCVADPVRITIRAGALSLDSDDWQSEGSPQSRHRALEAFSLDGTEVTVERWAHCVKAGACRAMDDAEPGLPVTSVDAKEAEHFCRFEGGRLPESDEWLFAAAGAEGRHFPWGQTGLVCRRAVFGVDSGPCASGGGADIAGSRPDGRSPEGVLDLAGNVAEWTLEADGHAVARGGSYLSRTVLELKTGSVENATSRSPHIGFRCAYGGAAR